MATLMTRTGMAFLLLISISFAQAKAPEVVLGRADIFKLLDEGRSQELEGEDVDRIYELLKEGRSFSEAPSAGAAIIPFTDDFGRETEVYLRIPEKPRGVLILLHGLGGRSGQLARGLYDDFAAAERLIVLAPNAMSEPLGRENSDAMLLGHLQPHWWVYDERGIVMTALRALARRVPFDRDRVFISGLSMGGFGAWNLGLRFADRFAAAAPIAGGISRREYIGSSPHELHHLLLDNAVHLPLYIAHGSEDPVVPVIFDRRLHEGLLRRDIDHVYDERKGEGHLLDLRPSQPVMKALTAYFSDKSRDPHPRRVVHRLIERRVSRSFWLRIDRVWASRARLDGSIEEGNVIKVKASGVRDLTVYIDETLVAADKPIKLIVNGEVLHEGKVKASLATVLESWREREDPAFVHRRALRVRVP